MRLPPIDMTRVSGNPYPETTLYGAIKSISEKYPDAPALEFYGKYTLFSEFTDKIKLAAAALQKAGIKSGDTITICMPNTPQAVICLYAANMTGAVANMVHPLSSQKNISYYIDYTSSKMILCTDSFYNKVRNAVNESRQKPFIVTARIQEELPFIKALAYKYFKDKDYLIYPDRKEDITWTDFLKTGKNIIAEEHKYEEGKTAVLLFSGGTSGKPKAVELTDMNFNALGVQMSEICGCTLTYGCKFLSVMPIFHGFGLGVGIHTVLMAGGLCILIPQFSKETYAKAVIKYKPNFIAGVPTLFEALLKVDAFRGKDLSFLIGIFSGGDKLGAELKNRIDEFLAEHNSTVRIREGYGLTESVAASCVTPVDENRTGSIGKPLRDMELKITEPGTFNLRETGKKGEIIISGPTVMSGYLGDENATSEALKKDSSGRTWLFTGDMGYVDKDGFVFYTGRLKRIIITSGYNVYPNRIENVLENCPDVDSSCVIGVRDPYRMQRVRAYIVLKDGKKGTEEEKKKILDFCREKLDVFERPREIIFRDELPRTLVGKVSYRTLEKEAEREVS